jgi:rRNA maturation endonuclease Nob1
MEVIFMTGEQKQHIQDMRRQGLSYVKIADALGISANTVKSFCRRGRLNACNASNDTGNKDICKHCGNKLKQTPKAKPKTFCSDKCRFDWWNTHRDKMARKGIYRLTCTHCGGDFGSYDKRRKYCGHACYISDRFGEGARRDERTV